MRTLVSLLAGLAACAGATPAPSNFVTPTGSGSGSAGVSKPGGAADVTIELGAADKFGDIKGVYFEPEALGQPGMPMTPPKKKMTIDKHRAEIGKAKDPVVKQAEAAIVATMLYERSKTESGDAQKKTRDEARQVLRDVLVAVGDKAADATVLRMLGSYELLFDDYPNAEKAWGALVAADPKDKDVNVNRAWWMYTLLKQGKNADAITALGSEKLTDKTPELAYTAAWAKWRTGDNAGAWQAIITAAKGWGALANREVVLHDVLLFAGRTDVTMAQALPDLTGLLGKDQLYKIDSDLGLKAYQFAGRWTDAIGALDAALQAGGAKTPPEDVPTIRYYEAVFSVPVDEPAKSAAYSKQALEALQSCGKCDPKETDNIMRGIYGIARLFHLEYATANDTHFEQPALDIYNAVVDRFKDPKTVKEASDARDTLQRTIKALKPTEGIHDKQAIGTLLSHHNQEAQACYEQALSANVKLAGKIVVDLESDQTGAIKGGSLEAPSDAGLQPVGNCVLAHAKKWKLPTRAKPGSTRLKLTYNFAKR